MPLSYPGCLTHSTICNLNTFGPALEADSKATLLTTKQSIAGTRRYSPQWAFLIITYKACGEPFYRGIPKFRHVSDLNAFPAVDRSGIVDMTIIMSRKPENQQHGFISNYCSCSESISVSPVSVNRRARPFES